MEEKIIKRENRFQRKQQLLYAGILFVVYYGIELTLLLILRFCFLGVDLSEMLTYCVISGSLLILGMTFRELWEKRACSDILLLGFTAFSLYLFGERIMSEVYIPIQKPPYWLNVALLWALMLMLYALCHSVRISVSVIGVLYTLLVIINAVLKQFRGRGVDAIDIYSIRAAIKVAGRFHYHVTPEVIMGLLCIAGMLGMVCFYVRGQRNLEEQGGKEAADHRMKMVARILTFVAGSCVFIIIFCTKLLEKGGLTPAYSSERNGMLFHILFQAKYLSLNAPDGYDAHIVAETANRYKSEKTGELNGYPNIIVIMNEALSDLSVYGAFETNRPVFPFLDSTNESMKRGYAYSSVYAGNTAVSEYEFLTGDSNALFQTMPYATVIKSGTHPETLVSNLKELGYTTVAMHSYYNSAYRRTTVYDVLGFDSVFFIEDMEGLEYLRGFATDASQYRTIYRLYEQKEDGERLFVFNVTMQNHMDYDYDNAEFTEPIVLTQCPNEYKKAEQYLSCIHESDRAFQELTNYFSTASEPTVILMFGDHQPELEEGFYNWLAETSDGREEDGREYLVPYVVWANYELGDIPYEVTSLNYLQAVLMETAGLPMTGYQQYLLDLQEEYPVISSHYMVQADGWILPTQNDTDELSEYWSVMYNHMSDISNNPLGFFNYR